LRCSCHSMMSFEPTVSTAPQISGVTNAGSYTARLASRDGSF
jgi:hypothetical protein